MSILIEGMEMPTSCHCCKMCVQVSDGDIDWHWECCLLFEKISRYATDRVPGCPLVPVPEHGEILRVLKTERECVGRDCDRNCGECDLSLERDEIVGVYDALITMLDPAKEGDG